MRVSIIGTGYVGLVTGVCLAEKGHHVVCVDVDQEKVDKINQGIPTIYEKGLRELLENNVGKRLEATSDLHQAVFKTDISLIAVGTPFDGEKIDLSQIEEVSSQIGKALRERSTYHVVVVKSTVVPGTTDDVVLPILEKTSTKKAGIDFGVGMNPEFMREGEAVKDFMFSDRIVLGGIDDKSIEALEELYSVFEGVDKLRTNNKTAEMIKYTSNSLLTTMISFSNEIANLCACLNNVDITEVLRGVHLDKRLTPILPSGERVVPGFTTYLEAGCGFGGSCFPKDLKALIAHGKRLGQQMRILEAVNDVNENQPQQVIRLLRKHFPSLKEMRIAVLGLAFKPGTDDMRESPAIPIISNLLQKGAKIKAYDPAANVEALKIFGNKNIFLCSELHETIIDAEAVLILTKWKEFLRIPEILDQCGHPPVVIDGRRMLDKCKIERYEGIGLCYAQNI